MNVADRNASAPATQWLERYAALRRQTVALCAPLSVEDYGVQSMADVSPPKWHLAHTSWFFETFILAPYAKRYRPFNPQYEYLFNSYYQTVGTPFPRTQRGSLSRFVGWLRPGFLEALPPVPVIDLAVDHFASRLV